MRRRTAIHRTAVACSCAALAWLGSAGLAQAQMVQYGTAMSMYKDMQDKEIKVTDTVTPGVAARSRVAKALADRSMVDARAMVGEDGTLRLPPNQSNLVIRTDYTDVTQGPDGSVRVASPVIQGNVSGNVTLYVEGEGVENITVLNNRR